MHSKTLFKLYYSWICKFNQNYFIDQISLICIPIRYPNSTTHELASFHKIIFLTKFHLYAFQYIIQTQLHMNWQVFTNLFFWPNFTYMHSKTLFKLYYSRFCKFNQNYFIDKFHLYAFQYVIQTQLHMNLQV